MRIPSGVVITAAAFCAWMPWISAQQPRPGQTPAFRSGTELVTVDVGVVDRQGVPLRGLGVADFVVTVDGQPRRVVTSEFVDVAAPQPDLATRPDVVPLSTNEGGGIGRQFVFAVDQSTLEPGSANRVASSASRFFNQLTFADRSALMLMPVGTNMGFTWAHNRVREALSRVAGLSTSLATFDFGSLAEARDISNSNQIALRSVGERTCRGSGVISASAGDSFGPISTGTTPATPAPTTPPAGGTPTGGGTSSPAPAGGTTSGSSGRGSTSSGSSGGFGGYDPCRRDIQMQAESAWRTAQMMTMSSVSAFREMLASLGRVRGDKSVILISGGWPLDDREVTSLMTTVATEAAAARVTLFTIFIPPTGFTASRRTVALNQSMDNYLYSWPLETLAAMTGGGSFRAEVSAESAFERIARELAGYYRIGVERDPTDQDRTNRKLKVQVSRPSVSVRARGIFDVRTFEDRDWAARLNSALEAPVPATGVGLRVTSYLMPSIDDTGQVNLLLTGEASRLQPGEATFQVLIRDLDGKRILSGEKPLGDVTGDTLPFSTNFPVPPGSYIVRIAVMDSAGHVGSIDHRVEARRVPMGSLSASGPLLVRVPGAAAGEDARFALDGVRQDERLALEVDLEGERDQLTGTRVAFEIATTRDGPALVNASATLSPGPRAGSVLAQAVAELRMLPPGQYVVRAKIASGSQALGEMRRVFTVKEAPRLADMAVAATVVGGRPLPGALAGRLPHGTVQPFVLDQALSPQILGGFLDRVAARSDASSPAMRDLLASARGTEIGAIAISDAEAANAPIAAFVKGLALLAQHKLDPAANAFRTAMRASADFYPAMVYLGVCFAAGGNDKEAAGAWRTALIKEGDTLALHVMLADAFLRQGLGDLALRTVDSARARWSDDEGLKRRFVVAALMAGNHVDGLQALDAFVEKRTQDEPALTLALQVLYEAFVNGKPVETAEQDRARMIRLADVYRGQGGPSLALIDTWIEAVDRKK